MIVAAASDLDNEFGSDRHRTGRGQGCPAACFSKQLNERQTVTTLHVPTMGSRASVRAISARLCDVDGVRTVEANLSTKTVVVTGSADSVTVLAAVAAAGHLVELLDTSATSIRPTGSKENEHGEGPHRARSLARRVYQWAERRP